VLRKSGETANAGFAEYAGFRSGTLRLQLIVDNIRVAEVQPLQMQEELWLVLLVLTQPLGLGLGYGRAVGAKQGQRQKQISLRE